MDVQISDNWVVLKNDSYDDTPKLREAARKNIRISAFSAMRMIKIRMPVDTGAARASWGSKGAAGIMEFPDNGMTNVQGSTLGYIEELNNGHSSQAPAGFLDVEQEKAVNLFVENMTNDMVKIIGS